MALLNILKVYHNMTNLLYDLMNKKLTRGDENSFALSKK